MGASLALFLLGGCSKSHQTQDSQFAPATSIESSFKIISTESAPSQNSTSDIKADRAKISIAKSALEKEFLLQVEMISQSLAPQFTGLESRIVSFRKQEGQIYLIETSQGHNYARHLPQTLLLAEFPIVAENETDITFDFNKGMSRLFVTGDWRTSDFGNMPESSLEALKAVFSYIADSNFKNNTLMIRQLTQLEMPMPNGTVAQSPYEVRYYLAPYLANDGFQPTVSPDTLDRMGFFEVNTLINDESGETTYASKRDVRKPIVFAVSANTPPDFKQAVKDGILYWNRALGNNLISVVDAPAGVNAPDFENNIVQWVDWDSAGFAYADAQMDPRTGEILHQQIYFTSAWALYGQMSGRQLAKTLSANNARTQRAHKAVALAGFRPQALCDLDLNQALVDGMGAVAAKDLTPQQALKAAQDLIREVVAHEVGHTMGLRHNFAGSLSASYKVSDREKLFKQYIDFGSTPAGVVTSSSVMDYQFPLESILNGDQIAKGLPVADYDRKAIQALYFGVQYKPSELPIFCTDSHVMVGLPDCRPYDAGSSMVDWVQYETRATIDSLPYSLLFRFQDAKAPLYGAQPTPIDQVAPSATIAAQSVLALERTLVSMYPENSVLLSAMRSFGYVNSSNAKEVRAKTESYLLAEIAKAGGLNKVLFQADLGFADREYAKFEKLLSIPENVRGTTLSGKPFAFSEDEIATMKQTAKQFYQALQTQLLKQEATILAGTKENEKASTGTESIKEDKFSKGDFANGFATYLSERATEFLFATTTSPMIVQKVTGSEGWSMANSSTQGPAATITTYTLPQFSYPFEIRERAANFLKPERSKDMSWGLSQKMALQTKYADFITASFAPIATMATTPAADIKKYGNAPQPLLEWLMDVLTIKAVL
jgi:hypothetical protein